MPAFDGSDGRQPPAGSGHGDGSSAYGRPDGGSGLAGCSVGWNVFPSNVPTSRNDPHVVPLRDSSPGTAVQSHGTMSGPPHCGGSDSATKWHSCGPWDALSSTVAVTA